MKITAKEFADLFGITYVQATGAIAFFVKTGIVNKTEEQLRTPSKKGKPSVKYEFPAAKLIIFNQESYDRQKRLKGKK